MNLLSPEKRDKLKELFLLGYSHRQISSVTGISKATTVRYAKEFQAGASCPCGGKAGHRGWCHWRYEYSPNRGDWMRERWKARGQSDVQQRIAEFLAGAQRQGHDPGPVLWTASTSTSLAYAKCRTCGALGYIKRGVVVHGHVLPETYRESARLSGVMFDKACIGPEEREQRREAALEKRSWREGKRTVTELKRLLRSNSRNEASTLAQTSHR